MMGCVLQQKSDSPAGVLTALQSVDNFNGAGAANCFDSSEVGILRGWAMEAQLVDDNSEYFCSDSGGIATTTIGSTISDVDVSCGP